MSSLCASGSFHVSAQQQLLKLLSAVHFRILLSSSQQAEAGCCNLACGNQAAQQQLPLAAHSTALPEGCQDSLLLLEVKAGMALGLESQLCQDCWSRPCLQVSPGLLEV